MSDTALDEAAAIIARHLEPIAQDMAAQVGERLVERVRMEVDAAGHVLVRWDYDRPAARSSGAASATVALEKARKQIAAELAERAEKARDEARRSVATWPPHLRAAYIAELTRDADE